MLALSDLSPIIYKQKGLSSLNAEEITKEITEMQNNLKKKLIKAQNKQASQYNQKYH